MYDLAIVVPVRRGSSRIVDKSMLPFGTEDSLIAWKLNQLTRVIDPERIYLSSEDDDFLAIGERFAVRPVKRDLRLATGHVAAFSEVVAGIVRDVPHTHIGWATVVCPLMAPDEYSRAFAAYHDRVIAGPHDSLVGVNPVQEYYWSDEGPLNYRADRRHPPSQQLPRWYRVTNSLYMAPRRTMLAAGYFLGSDPHLAPMSRFAGVDIDYLEDYRIARALYAAYQDDGLDAADPALAIDWNRTAAALHHAA